jgi:hypothetical protein
MRPYLEAQRPRTTRQSDDSAKASRFQCLSDRGTDFASWKKSRNIKTCPHPQHCFHSFGCAPQAFAQKSCQDDHEPWRSSQLRPVPDGAGQCSTLPARCCRPAPEFEHAQTEGILGQNPQQKLHLGKRGQALRMVNPTIT